MCVDVRTGRRPVVAGDGDASLWELISAGFPCRALEENFVFVNHYYHYEEKPGNDEYRCFP